MKSIMLTEYSLQISIELQWIDGVYSRCTLKEINSMKKTLQNLCTGLCLKLFNKNIRTLAMMANKALHKTPNLIGSY